MEALLDSFLLHLRGERKSAETVKSYRAGVRGFLSLVRAGERRRPSWTRPP